ncbi:MAG: hypothetical protein ACOC85_05475 [Thermoplasmatota archaeon]
MPDKTYKRGWKAHTGFNIAQFIREHLMEVEEDYVQDMYRELKNKLEEKGITYWGSRDSFGTYINDLRRLNLIRFKREGEAPFEGSPKRRYYEIVPEHKDSKAWNQPQLVLYPERVYGGKSYQVKKKEAEEKGMTVKELALEEHPELKKIREELNISNI